MLLDNKEEDLERLAELCLSTAKQIKEHLASTGHPQMTFDQNGPQFFPQDSSPMEIQLARLNLRAAAKRLYDLVSGPDEVIVWNTYDVVSFFPVFFPFCLIGRMIRIGGYFIPCAPYHSGLHNDATGHPTMLTSSISVAGLEGMNE